MSIRFIDQTVSDIRSERIKKGLGHSDLAFRLGVSRNKLSRWERGFEIVDDSNYKKIASILACDFELLKVAHEKHIKKLVPGEGYTTAKSNISKIFPRQNRFHFAPVKVLDLFCGAGGFSYGMELSGFFTVTAGIDLLSDRIETFRSNHQNASAILANIKDFSPSSLKDEALNPDLVIGGPPCQGFSSIRPFRNLTEGDQRNNLLEDYVLTIANIKPLWCVFENVVGLLTHNNGEVFSSLIKALKMLGYRLDWRIINAAYYGLPQNRERLVIIGTLSKDSILWPQPTHWSDHRSMAGKNAKRIQVTPLSCPSTKPAVTIMEAICDLPELVAGESETNYKKPFKETDYTKKMRNGSNILTLHDATAHSQKMLEIIRLSGANRSALPSNMTSSGFSSCYSRLDPDKPSVTLTVNFVHPSSNKCIHPFQDRALTPREGARLQGFHDTFEFCGTRAQIVKQIGNAVPPLLGEVIAKEIAKAMGLSLQKKNLEAVV